MLDAYPEKKHQLWLLRMDAICAKLDWLLSSLPSKKELP